MKSIFAKKLLLCAIVVHGVMMTASQDDKENQIVLYNSGMKYQTVASPDILILPGQTNCNPSTIIRAFSDNNTNGDMNIDVTDNDRHFSQQKYDVAVRELSYKVREFLQNSKVDYSPEKLTIFLEGQQINSKEKQQAFLNLILLYRAVEASYKSQTSSIEITAEPVINVDDNASEEKVDVDATCSCVLF